MKFTKFKSQLIYGLRIFRWIYHSTENPLRSLLKIVFKHPPYTLKLVTGKEIIISNKGEGIVDRLAKEFYKVEGQSFFLYKSDVGNFEIRGFNNPWTIICVFFFKDWRKLHVKGKKVLDIGGYVGDTAIYFIGLGAEKVISYEPFPHSFHIETDNIIQNGLIDKIAVLNRGVGGRDSNMTLNPEEISTNESRAISQKKGKGIPIPIDSLETIVSKYDIRNWPLKMNCEGCEYEVFNNVDTQTLRRFSEMQIHYHGDPKPLIKRLRSAGFRVKLNDYLYAKKI